MVRITEEPNNNGTERLALSRRKKKFLHYKQTISDQVYGLFRHLN